MSQSIQKTYVSSFPGFLEKALFTKAEAVIHIVPIIVVNSSFFKIIKKRYLNIQQVSICLGVIAAFRLKTILFNTSFNQHKLHLKHKLIHRIGNVVSQILSNGDIRGPYIHIPAVRSMREKPTIGEDWNQNRLNFFLTNSFKTMRNREKKAFIPFSSLPCLLKNKGDFIMKSPSIHPRSLLQIS